MLNVSHVKRFPTQEPHFNFIEHFTQYLLQLPLPDDNLVTHLLDFPVTGTQAHLKNNKT